jgi:hypothetical protein
MLMQIVRVGNASEPGFAKTIRLRTGLARERWKYWGPAVSTGGAAPELKAAIKSRCQSQLSPSISASEARTAGAGPAASSLGISPLARFHRA